MSHLDEGPRTGGFILTEQPGTLSRSVVSVTVGATTTLKPGLVLGKITSTGRYVPYANGATPASDGSEEAAAILYAKLVNDGVAPADFDGVVIDFGAEVRNGDLDWNSGDETAGKIDLAAAAIKVRD